jgi:hypothetical protein
MYRREADTENLFMFQKFALFRIQPDTLIILYIYNLVFYLSLHVSDRSVHHQEIKCFLSHKQLLTPFPRSLSVLLSRWC